MTEQERATAPSITLADLRRANLERQALWCPDQKPGLMFRACELGGEVGEALNVAKKLERERLGWAGSRATQEDLAKELADVVICTDLMAITAEIDLAAAVVAKFDETSDKVGLPTRLVAATPAVPPLVTDEMVEAALRAGMIDLSKPGPMPTLRDQARAMIEAALAAAHERIAP